MSIGVCVKGGKGVMPVLVSYFIASGGVIDADPLAQNHVETPGAVSSWRSQRRSSTGAEGVHGLTGEHVRRLKDYYVMRPC